MMKKLIGTVLLISVLSAGCVTNGQGGDNAGPGTLILNDTSAYLQYEGDKSGDPLLELKTDYRVNGKGGFTYDVEFTDPRNQIDFIDYELVFLASNGSGPLRTLGGHLELAMGLKSIHTEDLNPPVPVGTYQFTQFKIVLRNGRTYEINASSGITPPLAGEGETEKALNLGEKDQPVMITDKYPEISRPFEKKPMGLYWVKENRPGSRTVAWFVYADGEGSAVTLMELVYQGKGHFDLFNRGSLTICVSEQMVRDQGFWPRENYGNPYPFNMYFLNADGSRRPISWYNRENHFNEDSRAGKGQRMFTLESESGLAIRVPDNYGDYRKAALSLDKLTFQLSRPSEQTIFPVRISSPDILTLSLEPSGQSVLLGDVQLTLPRFTPLDWYTDPEKAEIIIEDDRIIARNTTDGREKVLCFIKAVQDNPGPGLWGDLKLEFTDQTEGQLSEIHFTTRFYEKRNNNYGGMTGRYVRTGESMTAEFPVESEKERETIGGYAIIDCDVTFIDGNTLSSPKLTGDFNNPFTLAGGSLNEADDWFSDPGKSVLVYRDSRIIALNRITGDEKLLVEIQSGWTPQTEGSPKGNYTYTFTDKSGGRILGGSWGGAFSHVNIGHKGNANVFHSAYRFDREQVNTNDDYDYASGNTPRVRLYMVKDRASDSPDDLFRDGLATLAFKDGNVLPVIFSD